MHNFKLFLLKPELCIIYVHRSYHNLLLQLGKWSHEIADGLVHAYLHKGKVGVARHGVHYLE